MLADGTTSNPKTPGTVKACGGYDVWKAFLGRLDPDAALQGFHVDPDGDDAEWTPTDGVNHTSKPVIDADWLVSHHATPATALGLERPDALPRLARCVRRARLGHATPAAGGQPSPSAQNHEREAGAIRRRLCRSARLRECG